MRRAESRRGRTEGTQGVGYPYCWRKLSLFSSLYPPTLVCFVKSAMAGITSSLVHFRWISSFIGFPFHVPFSFSLFDSPPSHSASVSFSLFLVSFLSLSLSKNSLSFSTPLELGLVLSFASLFDDISSIPSSNPRHFWARQESLCN